MIIRKLCAEYTADSKFISRMIEKSKILHVSRKFDFQDAAKLVGHHVRVQRGLTSSRVREAGLVDSPSALPKALRADA